MPKGSKVITTEYSRFHICNCGYQIQGVKSLINMKIKLHRKKCNTWKEDGAVTYSHGDIDLMPGYNKHHVNMQAYCDIIDIIDMQ